MTLSTTQNTTTVAGDGSKTVFTFPFVADTAADISVTYTNASGTQTVLSPSVYTLFINPPAVGQIWGIGGIVVYPLTGSPIAVGTSLTIARSLPLTQTISISGQGNFSPEAIEEALDTLCMQIQQINANAGSTVVSSSTIISALGYTPMKGSNNLSEITVPATARTNLALGTMAIQSASAVAVTGGTLSGVAISGSSFAGTVDNTVIGGTTPLAGTFTDITGSSLTVNGAVTIASGAFSISATSSNGIVLDSSGGGNVSITAGSGSSILLNSQNGSNFFLVSNTGAITSVGSLGLSIISSFAFTGADITTDSNLIVQTANKGLTLKRGSNGRVGTVTLTGTTAVTVSNTSIATSDLITFSLATVGGTVGAYPTIKTITPASGFTVAGSVSDTSTYNYGIIKSQI